MQHKHNQIIAMPINHPDDIFFFLCHILIQVFYVLITKKIITPSMFRNKHKNKRRRRNIHVFSKIHTNSNDVMDFQVQTSGFLEKFFSVESSAAAATFAQLRLATRQKSFLSSMLFCDPSLQRRIAARLHLGNIVSHLLKIRKNNSMNNNNNNLFKGCVWMLRKQWKIKSNQNENKQTHNTTL